MDRSLERAFAVIVTVTCKCTANGGKRTDQPPATLAHLM